jgi:TRAP-type mannitol/chloroaromatic compound transport system permease small subunit
MIAPTKVLRYIDKLNEYAYIGVSLLFVPLTCISMVEVAMRYLFNRPTIWAWDINVQLFSAIVVFGAGHTLFRGGHVTMDILISRFSRKTQLVCSLGTYLVFLFSMALVLLKVGSFAWDSVQLGERASTLFAPPVYPLKVGIFIGMTLLFLQAISVFVRDFDEFMTLLKNRGADR